MDFPWCSICFCLSTVYSPVSRIVNSFKAVKGSCEGNRKTEVEHSRPIKVYHGLSTSLEDFIGYGVQCECLFCNAPASRIQNGGDGKQYNYIFFFYSPHLCVGFLFLVVTFRPARPLPASRPPPTTSHHTTCSHTTYSHN